MAWFTYRIGAIFRETGIALDRLGCQLQGKGSYAEERALLSLRIAPSQPSRPNLSSSLSILFAVHTRPNCADSCACHPVSRHQSVVALLGGKPNVASSAFVAPSATVVGNVTIGANSSVWYGSVVRGAAQRYSHVLSD